MQARLNRRDFLKFSATMAASVGMMPLSRGSTRSSFNQVIRVATDSVSVYSQPSDESRIQYQHYRDDLVNYYYEVESNTAPDYNPRWYSGLGRISMHSADLQKVHYPQSHHWILSPSLVFVGGSDRSIYPGNVV